MPASIWKDEFIWKAYALAQEGSSDSEIARIFKVSKEMFLKWKKKYPALKSGLVAARKNKISPQSDPLKDFMYGRLSEDSKQVWNEIIGDDENNAVSIKRLDALLGGHAEAKGLRQGLWLHAWFHFNFNQSEACRRTGVSRYLVNHVWKKDPDFLNLFNEMNRIKGDFFESALIKGVRDGNPYLIVFANKTFNRDRGYGGKIDINLAGYVQHEHLVKIDDLDLSLNTRKELLSAMRNINLI